ncbi:MAG: alpha/beta hydrolase domain-containing protein [Burkholderiales bacterium]
MTSSITAVCGLALATLLTTPVFARVTELNIVAVEPFAESAAFGNAGAYERVRGTFKGELDPADARNKVIVNLDKAPRNAAGRIEYEADFFMLRPVEAARGNGKLIYDVTNRGRKYIHWRLMDARTKSVAQANDPRTLDDAGNGLLFNMGYTFVWSGWDPDAPRTNNGLSMKPIIATNNGKPIVRVIRDELVSGTRSPVRDTFRLTHNTSTLDQSQAKLTVRRREADAREEIPASGWAYVNDREIRLLPENTKPERGSIYEFHYPAKDPRVLGIGMAATRDLVSFMRYENADAKGTVNPARGIKATLGFGVSQSGRFLRDFVYQGFNQDERARKVLDGALAHTAGVGGVFLNAEFGQPARTNTQFEDHMMPENAFPFSTARMTDPVTGKTDGLMRGDGFDPLWMETNTSTEYWQKGASLLVTDPLGTKDVQLPANARAYLIAGTQHGGQAWMTSTPGNCMNPRNPHSPTPALRALLVALSEWVDGKAPPPSQTPRLQNNTLVAVQKLQFPAIPNVTIAQRVNAFGVLTDWTTPAMDMSKPYRPLVTNVDADGNETSGIRLPEIAVPLGTYTGWNLYKAPQVEGELCDRDGTFIPFATSRDARSANSDPRPSLEERYGTHAAYVKKVAEASQKLIAARLLLKEDAARLLERANSEPVRKRFGL